MSTGRNWREFNDAWRKPQWPSKLWQRVLFAEKVIKRLEPLGILLAVIGLAVSIFSFQIDYADRTVERKLRAWEIITSDGPINGGKLEAMEFLMPGRNLSGSKLTGVALEFRDLSGVNFVRADLRNADFTWANLKGADFSEADLSGAYLRKAYLSLAHLSEADLSKANLRNADLTWANLSRADLSGVDLREANLSAADLIGANLSEVRLRGTYFIAAKLNHANLRGANLVGTRGLTQEQLNEACGDSRTELPSELSIPACDSVDWYKELHGDG